MAWKIAEAFIDFRANGMQTVTAQINGLRGNLTSLGQTNFATGIETGMGRVQSALSGMKAAANAATPTIIGVGLAAAAAGKHAVDLAADYETSVTSFKVMLGSVNDAKRLMSQVQQFAAATPYESPEVVQATKALIAFGSSASTVIEEVRRLGDIASGVGMPIGELAQIYGKARVQGRLFAEDINQLTGRGIPIIGEIAKQLGIAQSEVRKAVEQGKVNFGTIETAFKNLTAEGGRFQGMMEEQSKTMAGIASTAKDDINSAFREMGDILGHSVLPKLAEGAAAAAAIAKAAFHHPDENGQREAGTGKEASEQATVAKQDVAGSTVAELKERRKQLRAAQEEQFRKVQQFNQEEREGRFNTLRLAKSWAGFDEVQDAKKAVGDLNMAIAEIDAKLNELGAQGSSKGPFARVITTPASMAAKAVNALPAVVKSSLSALKTNRGSIERAFGAGKFVQRGELGFEDSKESIAAMARAQQVYNDKIRAAKADLAKGDITPAKYAEEEKAAQAKLDAAKKQANQSQYRTAGQLRAAAEKQYKDELARVHALTKKKEMGEAEAASAADAAHKKKVKQLKEIEALEKAAKAGSTTGVSLSLQLEAMKKRIFGEPAKSDERKKVEANEKQSRDAAERIIAGQKTVWDAYTERMKEIETAGDKLSPQQRERAMQQAQDELDNAVTGKYNPQFRTKSGMIANEEREHQERLAELDAHKGDVGNRYKAMRQQLESGHRNRLADIEEQFAKGPARVQTHGLTDFARHIQQNLARNPSEARREQREKDMLIAQKKIATNTDPRNQKNNVAVVGK